jgi:hypothetical protein
MGRTHARRSYAALINDKRLGSPTVTKDGVTAESARQATPAQQSSAIYLLAIMTLDSMFEAFVSESVAVSSFAPCTERIEDAAH